MKEIKHERWKSAVAHSTRRNVLVSFGEVEAFQEFGHRCNLVVAFLPKQGHAWRNDEELVLDGNMKPLYLLTTHPATPEGAERALDDLFGRWDEEEDIKEFKSYMTRGAGSGMHTRSFHAQVAMILENMAIILWKYSVLADLRRQQFQRYVYEKVLRRVTVHDDPGHVILFDGGPPPLVLLD